MDALVAMLMKQYNIPKEQAQAYADDIHSRATQGRKGMDSAEVAERGNEDRLQTEAYTGGANAAIKDMDNLRMKFQLFTGLHNRRMGGEELEPDAERWYQGIRQSHDNLVRTNAQSAYKFKQEDARAPNLTIGPATVRPAPPEPVDLEIGPATVRPLGAPQSNAYSAQAIADEMKRKRRY